MTSLKRKRLDEILETSIEDIEKMFSWKIGPRKIESPMCNSTCKGKINTLPKRRKSECFSVQNSQSSQSSLQQQINHYKSDTMDLKQINRNELNKIKSKVPSQYEELLKNSIFWDSLDNDIIDDLPDIEMIDFVILKG